MEEKQMDKPEEQLPPAPQHQMQSMLGRMMMTNLVMMAEQELQTKSKG